MSIMSEQSRARVQRVQAIVREKTGLELGEQDIMAVHLLSLEPTVLAKSIVFSLTGNALDLVEEGDDEREAQTLTEARNLVTLASVPPQP
jgi:hypothetical protein